MPILHLLLILAAIGVVAWLIVTYIPMSDGFKRIITVVAIVAAVLICLDAFGVLATLGSYRVGR